MALVVGVLLAFAVGLFATGTGFDRDRAFYPTIAIIVASYYALFAVMGASKQVLVLELLAGTIFLLLAIAGFRTSLWFAVVALAGHGMFDLVHGAVIADPGVPTFWPPFCMAYDVTAAAYLAWRLRSGSVRAAV